jgi:hypothetical protein
VCVIEALEEALELEVVAGEAGGRDQAAQPLPCASSSGAATVRQAVREAYTSGSSEEIPGRSICEGEHPWVRNDLLDGSS